MENKEANQDEKVIKCTDSDSIEVMYNEIV